MAPDSRTESGDWAEYDSPYRFDGQPPIDVHEFPCGVQGCNRGATALISDGFRCRPCLLYDLRVESEPPSVAIPKLRGDTDE